jgi:hypothetical protein
MANRPIYPGTIKNSGLDIENADSTGLQTLLTAGTDGSRINMISAVSDDTAEMIVDLYINDGATDFLIGSVTVPTLSGTDGSTPAVSLLNATDLPYLGEDLSLFLEGGFLLKAAVQVAVTAAKKVTLVATYGDY